MVDIHKVPNAEEAAKGAAQAVTDAMRTYQDTPVLFLASGGSPLAIFPHMTPDLFDARVTISVTDERFNPDPAINNFAQLTQSSWFQDATARGAASIDTRPRSDETVEGLGWRMREAFTGWRMQHSDGVIVMTQGIGLDGHTVGIMPYPEDERAFGFLFDDADAWVVGYDAGAKNPNPVRATVTLPFLRMVDISFLYVCGPEKQKPLEATFAKDGSIHVTPARIIHEMKHCLLYTDCTLATVG